MTDSRTKNTLESPLVQELIRRMQASGLNQKKLALKAGLNETAVRDIRKGKSKHPRHDTVEKLAHALGCSAIELLNPNIKNINVDKIDTTLRDINNSQIEKTLSNLKISLLPLFDCSVPAPYPLDKTKSRKCWPAPHLLTERLSGGHRDNLFSIVIRGDSMLPTLKDSDLVIIDVRSRNIYRDGLYILHYEGGLICRRISLGATKGKVKIICDNKNFSVSETVSIQSLTIAGRVVWLGQMI